MLAGQITAPGHIELVDVPEPALDPQAHRASPDDPGQILFQPELACLCGSDLPYFNGQHGDGPQQLGHSLHEMIGTVIDTNGDRFRPGDRVLAVPVNQVGLFERFVLPETRAIPLDPRPEESHALLAQPLGTALFAMKKLPSLKGQSVVIVGQGPMGQIFNAVLTDSGATQIIGVDRLPRRVAISEAMGATTAFACETDTDAIDAVSAATDGRLADVVIEAVGHADQTLNLCIDLCRRGGRILSFGVPPETIDGLRWADLFRKNITVHTSVEPDFAVDFPAAMQLIAEDRIDLRPLLTHRFALGDIQSAYETFQEKRDGAQKVLIEFPIATSP